MTTSLNGIPVQLSIRAYKITCVVSFLTWGFCEKPLGTFVHQLSRRSCSRGGPIDAACGIRPANDKAQNTYWTQTGNLIVRVRTAFFRQIVFDALFTGRLPLVAQIRRSLAPRRSWFTGKISSKELILSLCNCDHFYNITESFGPFNTFLSGASLPAFQVKVQVVVHDGIPLERKPVFHSKHSKFFSAELAE